MGREGRWRRGSWVVEACVVTLVGTVENEIVDTVGAGYVIERAGSRGRKGTIGARKPQWG